MSKLEFPQDFYWGAATSAHQVEGGNVNQWSEWEKQNAAKLAEKAKASLCREKFPEMLNPANYISGRTTDHYHRFAEDFDLAKSLRHNAHRFSIEWSRIEPREGEFDQKEIEHYRRVVSALKERGIEPFVTLYHWTFPLWFRDKGGWENSKSPEYFEKFVAHVARPLKDVKFWMIANEPMIYAGHGYAHAYWPPQKRNPFKFFKVLNNLVRAHRLVHYSLHTRLTGCQVGHVENIVHFEGNILARLADSFWNHHFLKKVKTHIDFIGLNYYFHNHISGFKFNQNENKEVTDMGWEIYPEGIYHVLKNLRQYQKPIYITENGLADRDDVKREKFIKDHLVWVHKAIQEGVDARGYFHWSLLDNFEWDKGFWPRFGLIEVDFKTLERRIRPSARAYAQICQTNTL